MGVVARDGGTSGNWRNRVRGRNGGGMCDLQSGDEQTGKGGEEETISRREGEQENKQAVTRGWRRMKEGKGRGRIAEQCQAETNELRLFFAQPLASGGRKEPRGG